MGRNTELSRYAQRRRDRQLKQFAFEIDPELHARLAREASRRTGDRGHTVTMREIVTEALEKELPA